MVNFGIRHAGIGYFEVDQSTKRTINRKNILRQERRSVE